MCQYPADLFLNSVRLRRVGSVHDVRSGNWYINDRVQTIYIGDNPTGQTVELSTTPSAFSGSSDAVSIRGLVLEKYANIAQQGAIHDTGQGWIIENNEVRLNHSVGLVINTHAYVHS